MPELENNKKIRANAVSAYLLVIVSGAFLFAKNNPFLNNSFVKSHTKMAFSIHMGFLLTYIIFLHFGLGINLEFFGYNISQIIAISLFLLLLMVLFFGIYKANNGQIFSLLKTISKEDKKLIDINSDNKFNEKDKLTIILSRIPLVGFLIYPKFKGNKIIENTTKLNLIFSVLIFALYIFGNPNLSTLLLLFYIVSVVFLSINLIVNDEVVSFNLDKVPSVENLRIGSVSLVKYLKNYFSKDDFVGYAKIYKQVETENKNRLETEEKELKSQKEFKLPDVITYIPILNLISLFNLHSKLKKHIINGSLISIMLVLSWVLFSFGNKYQLLLLFPIFFGAGNLKSTLSYEVPFLYDLYLIVKKINTKIKNMFSFVRKKQKEEKKLNLKVED